MKSAFCSVGDTAPELTHRRAYIDRTPLLSFSQGGWAAAPASSSRFTVAPEPRAQLETSTSGASTPQLEGDEPAAAATAAAEAKPGAAGRRIQASQSPGAQTGTPLPSSVVIVVAISGAPTVTQLAQRAAGESGCSWDAAI
jgi:hypothetical protein